MTPCLFAADLHGKIDRWESLFAAIAREAPRGVFLGGDLLPSGLLPREARAPEHRDFVRDFLAPRFERVRRELAGRAPRVFLILGNDDPRFEEEAFLEVAPRVGWEYAHDRRFEFGEFAVVGYSFVPPTPFLLKDWERYDVSRYVDPSCVSPEEGYRSVPVPEAETRHATMAEDLARLAREGDVGRTIFLFHSPPYRTALDRADLDGRMFEHVPLDVHVGSIAIRRFVEEHQPLVTLHGHVHESARLTGAWRDRIGKTRLFSAAHDGPELALVRFDPECPDEAERILVQP
jgi:Icc-related predicted phosphoesterase